MYPDAAAYRRQVKRFLMRPGMTVICKRRITTGPRFSDTGDATVIDHFSGLMWTRNADKGNGKVDWAQAIAGAAACTDGGFTDWRLPNRHELASLIDLGKYNPALPAGHPFIGVQPSYYWTSSTPANNENHAWLVHFYIGFVTHDDKGGSHFAWFVRDGK